MAGFIRLEADGLTTLELDDANGFDVEAVDLGFPSIRAVADSRVDADGEDDRTAHIGARAVVLSGVVVPTATLTRQAVLDRIRAFLRPDLRSYLVFELEAGVGARRIRLRGDQAGAVIERPGSAEVTFGWSGPDGIIEAETEASVVAEATPDVEVGREYPLEFPRAYPTSSPLGVVTVTNAGTVTAYPVLELYGPCTNPRIENQTTGGALVFSNLTLADGEMVEIDTRERTIFLEGDELQSRYDRLDFAESSWWALAPGDNSVRFYPESFDVGCEAVVLFRSAWL